MRRPSPVQIGLRAIGIRPMPTVRRHRKPPPGPTREQLQVRNLERAFRCGARYALSGWPERAPPRMRRLSAGHPDADLLLEQRRAFHRGWRQALWARFHERQALKRGVSFDQVYGRHRRAA